MIIVCQSHRTSKVTIKTGIYYLTITLLSSPKDQFIRKIYLAHLVYKFSFRSSKTGPFVRATRHSPKTKKNYRHLFTQREPLLLKRPFF